MTERHVLAERIGALGVLTLNRAQALNALSLQMIRDLTAALLQWRDDPAVQAVGVGHCACPCRDRADGR